MRYCAYCGKQIREYIKYCPYCGHKIDLGEDLSQRVDTGLKTEKTVDHEQAKKTVENKEETKKEEVKENKDPLEKKREVKQKEETSLKKDEEVKGYKKLTTSLFVNRLVKIYSIIALIIGFILYGLYNQADTMIKEFTSSRSGLYYLKNALSALSMLPGLYSGMILFAVVIIGLSIYRYIKNSKGKVHLLYITGLVVNIIAIYQFNDVINIINEISDRVSNTSSVEDLFDIDYGRIISTFKSITTQVSSYKTAAIIIFIVVIFLLIISILSKMQAQHKIMLGSFISMDGKEIKKIHREKKIRSEDDEDSSLTIRPVMICILALVVTFGGLTSVNLAYLSRTKVDVMQNLKLHYYGTNGSATAKIFNEIGYNGKSSEIKNFLNNDLTYYLSKNSDISNGDIITVTVKYDTKKASNLKLNIMDTSKEITVSGLSDSIEYASEISDDLRETLESDSYTNIKNLYADDNTTYDIDFDSAWLIKDDDSSYGNRYVGVYKMHDVNNDDYYKNFYAYAYTNNLTSQYDGDDAKWTAGYYDIYYLSNDDLQSRLSRTFEVDYDNVESIE